MTYKIEKTDAQWKALLSQKGAEPMAFDVTRHEATERAYTGKLEGIKAAGIYSCICCSKPLFDSAAKFESGSGWPSYFQPIAKGKVTVATDSSHGMPRDEVVCSRCGGHLGHVFDDGPQPTGLRYCMNSVSLKFAPAK